MPRGGSTKQKEVISREEAEACTERLYGRAMEDMRRNEEKRKATLAHPPGRLPPKKISAAEVESLTQRMYEKQIEHQRIKQEQNDKKKQKELDQTMPHKTLTEEELADSVARMYTQTRDIHQKNLEKLERKYHPHPEKKTLTKDEVKGLGDRLAKDWKQKREEAKKKIWDRDYAPMEPKKHTITPDDVKAMGDRLCTTKGGH